jgi:hypothetical protein
VGDRPVILPRFEDGQVAVGMVVAGIGFIIAVGLVRAVAVVVRRSFASRGQWQVKAGLQEQVLAQYQTQPVAWHSATARAHWWPTPASTPTRRPRSSPRCPTRPVSPS